LERGFQGRSPGRNMFALNSKHMKKIISLLIVLTSASSCQEENLSLKEDQPEFRDFNYLHQKLLSANGTSLSVGRFFPAYGLPGTEVTITGSGFGSIISNIRVGFTEVVFPHFTTWIEATVLEVSPDRIRVIVPEGAITGKVTVVLRVEEWIGESYVSGTSLAEFDVLRDIPRDGLVAFYPFTRDGDEKGLNNPLLNFDLSAPLAPTLSNDRFDKVQQAINFEGPQNADLLRQVVPGNFWTISFWMNHGTLTIPEHHVISTYVNNVGLDVILSMRPDGNYSFRVIGNGGSIPYTLTPTQTTGYFSPAATGDWINITLTYDGSTFKIYKDGFELVTNTIAVNTPPGARFNLGSYVSTNNYLGKMDDVIVYDHALSPGDVIKVFEQTISKY
jgi:hypothetical protein